MTRDYSKKHNHDDDNGDKNHDADAATAEAGAPPAGEAGAPPTDRPQRTVPISTIHEQEIEKARAAIGELVAKARAVEFAREDPLASRPEGDFIAELQDIFRKVHRLNARWFAGPGYEYVPPAAVNAVTAPDLKDNGTLPKEPVLVEQPDVPAEEPVA